MVLSPNKEGSKDLKDFRPISLVESLHRFLVEVIENKIKKVSHSQHAFAGRSQIWDSILIANNVIDSRLRAL